MQIKVIFIRMVSHLDFLLNRGTREVVNGLFSGTTEVRIVITWLVYIIASKMVPKIYAQQPSWVPVLN